MNRLLDERRRAMLAEMGIVLFEHDPPTGSTDGTPPEPTRQAGGESRFERDPPSGRTDGTPPDPPRQAGGKPAEAAGDAPSQAVVAPRAGGVELMEWDALEQAVASCRACKLCAGRRNTVFGVGHRQADWLVVGEAPGEQEDLQGEPFVGQAGKLLDNMLKALGLDRHSNVYIANVLKCRPPGNRNPQPDEVAQCEPFLRRQVALLQPRIILAMGRFAVQTLLGSGEPIGKLRGRAHQYLGVPVVVTYHPAYLLRNLPDKAKAWSDLCLALELTRGQAA